MTDIQHDALAARVTKLEHLLGSDPISARGSEPIDQFAADLLEAFIAAVIKERGDGPVVRSVVSDVRRRFKNDPATITGPIQEALEKNNLELKPKGT